MRTKITTTQKDTVRIDYVDATGGRVTREFFTRGQERGYVWEWRADGDHRQVCSGLSSRGSTLVCIGTLADTIRREYRAMRRAERKGA